MLETARAAGRDPAALEYTRWGAIDMTADDVAAHAASGTTRLVVGPAAADLSEQRDQISAFAARLALAEPWLALGRAGQARPGLLPQLAEAVAGAARPARAARPRTG